MPSSGRLLLACDVGNSRIKAALFRQQQPASSLPELPELPECLIAWTMRKDEDFDWSPLREPLRASGVEVRGIIAGANPDGVARLKNDWPCDEVEEPVVVESADGFPLEIDVEEPRCVGIDRLLNALAGNVIRPPDRPTVIIDSGTATTVDVVDSEGRFRGGAILPGFELSARALNRYTALLPLISVEELTEKSHSPLGRDTRAALRSGLFWGQLGAVRELIRRLSADSSMFDSLGESVAAADSSNLNPNPRAFTEEASRPGQPATLLLTGGGASLLKPHLRTALSVPHLSLQGLALFAEHLAK